MSMKVFSIKAIPLLITWSLVWSFIGPTSLSWAQDDDMAYSVATTWEDQNGTTWVYILWQATQANRLKDRHFAIYEKFGDAATNNDYTQVGITSLETDPDALQLRLNDASYIGEDLGALEGDLDEMFEGLIDLGGPLTLREKLAAVIAGAIQDDALYDRLLFLGRVHPGVNLCLGLAFAKKMDHDDMATFELREYDLDRDLDLNVMGRLTLDAGSPATPLPPPGDLFEVPREDGQGHLNVRLRWATPNDLRRVSLLQYGFNLYRIEKTFAESNGFHTAPPLTDDLIYLAETQAQVVRVNRAPVLSTADYDNATVVTAPNDEYFVVDDNNRFAGGEPFVACDRFYYFTTARDILGRDGDVSPGLQVTVCDRLPPIVPKQLSVANNYDYDTGTQTGDQRLKVTWKQNDENDPDAHAVKYYVYRWDSSQEALAYENDPVMNRIAIVNHLPGEDENSYIDDQGPNAPQMPADANKTYWYTVRAVDDNDCTGCKANVSGNSAAAYGVLRDRVGPTAGTGTITLNCGDVKVVFHDIKDIPYGDLGFPLPAKTFIPDLTTQVVAEDNCPGTPLTITQQPAPGTQVQRGVHPITITVTDASGNSTNCQTSIDLTGPTDNFARYRFKATQTAGIAWAEFYLGEPDSGQFLGRVNFRNGDTQRYIDYTVSRSQPGGAQFTVFCRVGNIYGDVSTYAKYSNKQHPPHGFVREICFQADVVVTPTEASDDCTTHIPVLPGTNTITPVIGTAVMTATTRQWKLYRRIDQGEQTLLSQGTGEFSAGDIVSWEDDALPSNNSQVCYFIQLFDEHGNASPMAEVGCIRVHGTNEMGAPMMVSLDPAGDLDAPAMTINWFGERDNVDRFHVYIASDPGELAEPLSELLSPNDAPSPNLIQVDVDGNTFDADFAVYRTPRLGGSRFSDVPMFQVTIPVEVGNTYTVLVRGVDANNQVGEPSNALQFAFPEHAGTPPIPANNVPWPAREQPAITQAGFAGRVIARQLFLDNGFRGVGIRIGEVDLSAAFCMSGLESTPYFTPGVQDPRYHLYVSDNQPEKPILPIAIYRYQVPNGQYGQVSGDMVQVSPLLEQVAFRYGFSPQFQAYGAILEDPFFAITPIAEDGFTQPCSAIMPDLRGNYDYDDCFPNDLVITQDPAPGTYIGLGTTSVTITATDRFGNQSSIQTTYTPPTPIFSNPVTYEIFALDTQPVVEGASYRYLLVRFKENHEIDQVIPVDPIEVSSAL